MPKRFLMMAVGLIALLAAVGWYSAKPDDASIISLPCEDIKQGCGNDRLTVRFAETPSVMQPLHLSLHFKQPENIQDVHIDFAMQTMQMGLNRYRLMPSHQRSDWQAEVTLPLCVQGRSDWLMLIEIDTGKQIERVQIPFTAQANH